jgi:hypothetical protein
LHSVVNATKLLKSDRTIKVQNGIFRKVNQRLIENVQCVIAARFELA